MSEKSPEQLLSEALRAKAVQAPPPEPVDETTARPPAENSTDSPNATPRAAPGRDSLFSSRDGSFELLSGQGYRPGPRARVDTASGAKASAEAPAPTAGLPVAWILLLALLLGAAAGAVAGLLTLR